MKSIVPRLAFSCTTLYVRFLAENARFVAANISNYCRTKNDPCETFAEKEISKSPFIVLDTPTYVLIDIDHCVIPRERISI
jgi:hypothetical protein